MDNPLIEAEKTDRKAPYRIIREFLEYQEPNGIDAREIIMGASRRKKVLSVVREQLEKIHGKGHNLHFSHKREQSFLVTKEFSFDPGHPTAWVVLGEPTLWVTEFEGVVSGRFVIILSSNNGAYRLIDMPIELLSASGHDYFPSIDNNPLLTGLHPDVIEQLRDCHDAIGKDTVETPNFTLLSEAYGESEDGYYFRLLKKADLNPSKVFDEVFLNPNPPKQRRFIEWEKEMDEFDDDDDVVDLLD